MKLTDIDHGSWQELASERVRCRWEVRKGLARSEEKQRRAADEKRIRRKNRQPSTPGASPFLSATPALAYTATVDDAKVTTKTQFNDLKRSTDATTTI